MNPGRAIWDDAASAVEISGALTPAPLDVAVVGGGLAGLSVAYHALLRHPGLRVAVIEAGLIGGGASGRSTGMVGPGVGQSLGALVRRLGRKAAGRAYAATLDAVRTTVALVRREGIACDLEETGQILVARSRGDRRRLHREAALMADLYLPHAALDDAHLETRIRLGPAEGSDADGPAGLRLSTAALVHPGKLVAGLAARVRARGGVLCQGLRVQPIRSDARTGSGLTLDAAPTQGNGPRIAIAARRVVVATGGYTPSLRLFTGRVLPLHLQALATAPLPPEALHHLAWGGREGIVETSRVFNYFRLTHDNRLVFGGGTPRYLWNGTSAAASAARALQGLESTLRRRFAAVPGMARVPITHAWTGLIDYVLDGLPMIGARRDEPRLLHVLGLCGHGLALSVAAGAWLADRLDDDGAPQAEVSALAPSWLRDRPGVLLPTEPVRWLACHAALGAMRVMDRLG
jgi:glycine/D-amino acid oxidase-like deaminating enzyme